LIENPYLKEKTASIDISEYSSCFFFMEKIVEKRKKE